MVNISNDTFFENIVQLDMLYRKMIVNKLKTPIWKDK